MEADDRFSFEEGPKKKNLIINTRKNDILGIYEGIASNGISKKETGKINLYKGNPTTERKQNKLNSLTSLFNI